MKSGRGFRFLSPRAARTGRIGLKTDNSLPGLGLWLNHLTDRRQGQYECGIVFDHFLFEAVEPVCKFGCGINGLQIGDWAVTSNKLLLYL